MAQIRLRAAVMSEESSKSIEYSQHIGLVTRERDHRASTQLLVERKK